MMESEFKKFLEEFIPKVEVKSLQLAKLFWILETTGSKDASDLLVMADCEYKMMFRDEDVYKKLLAWKDTLSDPILERECVGLIKAFKVNMIPEPLMKEISQKEADISLLYANYRPTYNGKSLSENDIKEILKKENDPKIRKEIWNISKSIGSQMAPKILALVKLRNQVAAHLGYKNYFEMQLDLQEVDSKWLFATFEELAIKSNNAYLKMMKNIEDYQMKRFNVSKQELGPWAWSEPFCQDDPMGGKDIDNLIKDVNLLDVLKSFYTNMGFDINPILERSDLYERPGKNQHAFCINIDKKDDVRTLNNVKQTISWLDTLLHEFGHAVYELGFDKNLPWLLRSPPHMITTEAMALVAGRQAHKYKFLNDICKIDGMHINTMKESELSQKRRQLIFSRWVLVMTFFEKELYSNPNQDLNKLWWNLVEKYQMVSVKDRDNKEDWSTKYHIAAAPVYYYSYLVGEVFASALTEKLKIYSGQEIFWNKKTGEFLRERLFAPGDSYKWDQLIEKVLEKPLSIDEWLTEFAKSS